MAHAQTAESNVVEVVNASGRHEIVLVCEHASSFIPEEFEGLGLSEDIAQSHIGWDPGAGDTAVALSGLLDAVLVRGTVSRLVYDCNRPPESPDAIRQTGETGPIPGNTNLGAADIAERVSRYYEPFRQTLAQALAGHHSEPVLVTIHSFTPVLDGQVRDVEVGILHDADSRLANLVLEAAHNSAPDLNVRRNEPYGPEDGVTHTLRAHGLPKGLLNVMIEVRNDLLVTPTQCEAMAARLNIWLETALASFAPAPTRQARA